MTPSKHRKPRRGHGRLPSRSQRALAVVGGLALVGGFLVATQPGSASATPERDGAGSLSALPRAVPPDGKSWIQGTVTDQAGKALDNINVEVWPASGLATEPTGSNLSYAGVPADAAHAHGVFRIEVPSGAPYVVILSAVGGKDDGDQFRKRKVSGGAPIMARAAAAGRVIKVGTIQLARHGLVKSKITAKIVKPKKGKAGVLAKADPRYRLKVTVKSKHVKNVTGKLVIKIGGRKITEPLRKKEHGKDVILLPKNLKDGKHKVLVSYAGSKTVAKSKAKPVKLKIA